MHWPTSLEDIGIVNFIAAIAVLMNIAGYLMKTMIPLRLIAMITNALFIAYSILATVYPTLILHIVLLPINVVRFFQMKRLIRQVNEAANGDLSMDWLKPYGIEQSFRAGATMFRRGDPATELHFLLSGRCRVVEPNVEMNAGSVIGELGLLEPGRTRTATVECIEDCETLAISYDNVLELYFQNPTFGFYFLQLSTARLFHTIKSLEAENAALRAANEKLSAAAPA